MGLFHLSALPLFFALLVGHALCDYPLQGDFLARAKNHTAPIVGVPWYQALTAHALIQAGAVWLVTGSLVLFGLELVAHWCIDRWKCGAISYHARVQAERYDIDQALHLVCKAVWVWLLAVGLA